MNCPYNKPVTFIFAYYAVQLLKNVKTKDYWSGYSRSHFNKLAKTEHESFLKEVYLLLNADKSQMINVNFLSESQPCTLSSVVNNPSQSVQVLSDLTCSSKLFSEFGPTETSGPSYSYSGNLSDTDDEVYDDELGYISESSDLYDTFPNSSDHEEEIGLSDKCEANAERPLKFDLASYVSRRGVPTSHVNEFLNILHKHKDDPKLEDLPRSHTSLMQTSKKKIAQRSIPTKPTKSGATGSGSLYYRGIATAIRKRKELVKHLQHIVLDIGIDGANKYNSSKLTLWPIIGDIINSPNIRPFCIACYEGQGKANNSDDLFDEFLVEVSDLMKNGIELSIDGQIVTKSVSIRLFKLDSAGRANFCKIMAHSSYQGCSMCKFTEKTAESQKKKRNQKRSTSEPTVEVEMEDEWQQGRRLLLDVGGARFKIMDK